MFNGVGQVSYFQEYQAQIVVGQSERFVQGNGIQKVAERFGQIVLQVFDAQIVPADSDGISLSLIGFLARMARRKARVLP